MNKINLFKQELLKWSKKNKREYSWRDSNDPWKILLLEIIAQQTQLDRANIYYEKFIKRFPTPKEMSIVTKKEILSLWSGLGYNSRALRLHEASKILSKNSFNSIYPNFEVLPGVGKYTKNAILSFAYKEKVIAQDTNVVRIFSRFFGIKNPGNFIEENLLSNPMNGLWQRIIAFDIDKNGEKDYLLGNWGTNSKFKASQDHPLRMYYADFDNNGSTETIVCIYKNGRYYPLLGLDELASQIVSLRKKFTNYKSFAGKSIDAIFDSSVLKKAAILEVHQLASGYLKNENNSFRFVPFKNELQVSPISSFLEYDFNADGKKEILTAGNYFGVTPFHGRFDSFPGALIFDENQIILGNRIGLDFNQKAIKNLNIFAVQGKQYLLATINNDSAQVYQITKTK